MADTEDSVTDEEKIRIISNFLLHSPPGESNEVFNDVRVLVNDDFLLKQAASEAFALYNMDQQIPVKIDGTNYFALITHFNYLPVEDRFYDARSRKSFKYDHLRKEASDFKVYEPDHIAESYRRALEEACLLYTQEHFKSGTCAVFGSSEDNTNITLTACIEGHEFETRNYWNGRWRSTWSCTFNPETPSTVDLLGTMKVQIHVFENGNVALLAKKEVKEILQIKSELDTATELMEIIENSETEYQLAITENYQQMSDTTFKALRRLLPVTRTKIDWQKILTFKKLGSELKRGEGTQNH